MEFILIKVFFPIILLITLFFSVLIDYMIGDPHLKLHPVNLIGKLLIFLKNKIKSQNAVKQKLLGIFVLIFSIILIWLPLFLIQFVVWWLLLNMEFTITSPLPLIEILLYSLINGFILKWSFALRNLWDVSEPIVNALRQENIEEARAYLSYIVRRDTNALDKPFIISATVECIAESSTDAFTSVIWFYLLGNFFGFLIYHFFNNSIIWLFLGIPFAYLYRVINTADSIVGYKNPEYINIGWFSARMDDLANYIPTRLTTFFMLFAGWLIKKDVGNAVRVLKKERNSLESINAGWTIGTMAGLLGIQLEKKGKYQLGVEKKAIKVTDIEIAYKIVRIASLIFIISLTFLCIYLLYLTMKI